MGRHAKTCDLFHLQLDITVNQIIIKYATSFKKIPINIKRLKGLCETGTNRRDIFNFFSR